MNTPEHYKTTAELKRQKLIGETRKLELQIEEMNKRQCGEYVATAYFSDGTSRHVRGGPGMADQASAKRIEMLEGRIAALADKLTDRDEHIESLQGRIENFQHRVKNLMDECATAAASAERIESLVKSLESMTPELNERRAQVIALRNQIARMNDTIKHRSTSIEAARNAIRAAIEERDIARSAAKIRLRGLRALMHGTEFQTYDFDETP